MKNYLAAGLSAIALLMVGCGGGGSGSSTGIAEIIEDQDFYRYISADEKYYKEFFDGNGTLHKLRYFYDGDFIEGDDVLDENTTSEYYIDGALLYITDNSIIEECRVEDMDLSVKFTCSKVGGTGAAVVTTRWKTLEDAVDHPEDE
ncbi:hypothetical protein [Sulfurovum mangrovi]|uniref:hypothetical protein n=1 Tax=Sulfurovum mangrovi TaxID=2893889 RepID=UPI001E64F304|nr:hypothetical protein [Sulfurovum mangrovi]UFH59719.1 hypothetical protein LN246_02425 [Sulfurovum mangrovi]UFH60864.1 hypothetical protein LN246_15065 [Sulfurovum mangrovi]